MVETFWAATDNKIFRQSDPGVEFFKLSEMPETAQVTRTTGSRAEWRLLPTDRALVTAMRSLLVLLAACGSADVEVAPPVAKARAPVHVPAPIAGVHGSTITQVGATEDGTAAVTADQLGAMRLWPTLDGLTQPIVIAGCVPHALALAHDDDGFVIADLDAAGGAELIRTSASGQVRSRGKLPGDQPITRIDAVPSGLLVVRADQAIELYDVRALRKFRLVPEPSTHLVSIAVRAGRALAFVSDDHVVRGRWIELEQGVWGASTPVLSIDPAHVVLSPDHKTIAALASKGNRHLLIDALTGKAIAGSWCALEGDGEFEGFGGRNVAALGFIDDQTVACSMESMINWWSAGKPIGNTTNGTAVAVSDRRLIVGMGVELQLATPTELKYLGYASRDFSHLRVAPPGLLVGKGDQTATILDASFHPARKIVLPESPTPWLDMIPLDQRYLLLLALDPDPETGAQTARLSLHDTTNQQVVALPFRLRERELTYDPATRLLATTDGDDDLLLRWEPAQLGPPLRIAGKPQPGASMQHPWGGPAGPVVHLVDPVLTNGLVALVIHEEVGSLTVQEIQDARPGLPFVLGRTYHVPGALRSVDRAGHIFTYASDNLASTAVVGYTRGIPTALLADTSTATLRPSPDGTMIAAFDGAHLTMHDAATGAIRWEVSLWGLASVLWTEQGQLVARFAGALAEVDRETGALGDRQCGWELGLADAPHETIAEAPSVCDVAP